jgi:hypothetical protein
VVKADVFDAHAAIIAMNIISGRRCTRMLVAVVVLVYPQHIHKQKKNKIEKKKHASTRP